MPKNGVHFLPITVPQWVNCSTHAGMAALPNIQGVQEVIMEEMQATPITVHQLPFPFPSFPNF